MHTQLAIVAQPPGLVAYTTSFDVQCLETLDHMCIDVDAQMSWEIRGNEDGPHLALAFMVDMKKLGTAALPSFISGFSMGLLLFERERTNADLTTCLENYARPWGVTVMSASITQLGIPRSLQDENDARLLAVLRKRIDAHRARIRTL